MTRDASTQTRTILVHINIEVEDDDERTAEQIAEQTLEMWGETAGSMDYPDPATVTLVEEI